MGKFIQTLSRFMIIGSLPALLFPTNASASDDISGWCAKVTKPSSIVICTDPELRRMALARNVLFAEARNTLTPEAYQILLDDQWRWIKNYTRICGVASDGPTPLTPIAQNVIDCYQRAGRERIAYLTAYLGRTPSYQPQVPLQDDTAANERAKAAREAGDRQMAVDAENERRAHEAAERQAAINAENTRRAHEAAEKQAAIDAENARERLKAQAAVERETRVAAKLKELGFALVSPIDLELDWRDLSQTEGKIAIRGVYSEYEDVEGLSVANKDHPLIRLYTVDASRDARKTMLECRNSDFTLSSCQMIVAVTVISCIKNKEKLNEKELPCLNVREAFVLPQVN
jgi:hypothetical protein